MVDRELWREVLWRTGKTERRGGYSRSWRGVYRFWRDMIRATPMLSRIVDASLCRGDYDYRRATW